MSIQALKERSRIALHKRLSRVAHYYAAPGAPTFAVVSARVHTKMGMVGDMSGTSLSYAEHPDPRERVLLLVSEVPEPARGGLILLSPTEGYWIDTVDPKDGLTVSVAVTFARESELAAYEAP